MLEPQPLLDQQQGSCESNGAYANNKLHLVHKAYRKCLSDGCLHFDWKRSYGLHRSQQRLQVYEFKYSSQVDL